METTRSSAAGVVTFGLIRQCHGWDVEHQYSAGGGDEDNDIDT